MKRPRPDSQAGRILSLLESADGGKVSLLAILSLRISQYSARIHDLRHRFGFRIENGSEPGRPDHTWFRLGGSVSYDTKRNQSLTSSVSNDANGEFAGLFSDAELARTARWEDNG